MGKEFDPKGLNIAKHISVSGSIAAPAIPQLVCEHQCRRMLMQSEDVPAQLLSFGIWKLPPNTSFAPTQKFVPTVRVATPLPRLEGIEETYLPLGMQCGSLSLEP